MSHKIGVLSESSSPPAGWVRWSTGDNKFLRGAATVGGTGGSSTHTHTFSAGSTTTTGCQTVSPMNDAYPDGCGAEAHEHYVSATPGIIDETGSSLPKLIDVGIMSFNEVFDEV